MNTGIALASRDVVISCDADIVLTHATIEELVRRHEAIGPAVLIGFRSDIQPDDPRLKGEGRFALLRSTAIAGDNRLVFDFHGWPENMCLAMNHLRRMGGRRFWMTTGQTWDLPRMVFGCLFSMLRRDLEFLSGFAECFRGWGWEDTHLAARAIALGRQVVPVYTASGFHVARGPRSPKVWEEGRRNRRRLQSLLDRPLETGLGPPRTAAARIRSQIVKNAPAAPDVSGQLADVGEPTLASAHVLALVGRFAEALEAARIAALTPGLRSAALLQAGRVLGAAGRHEEAIECLREAVAAAGAQERVAALIELATSVAATGAFAEARHELGAAGVLAPDDREVRYRLRCPGYRHVAEAVGTRRRATMTSRYGTSRRHSSRFPVTAVRHGGTRSLASMPDVIEHSTDAGLIDALKRAGVLGNVDHPLVRDTVVEAYATERLVILYEDRPYAAQRADRAVREVAAGLPVQLQPVCIDFSGVSDQKLPDTRVYRSQLEADELDIARAHARRIAPATGLHEGVWVGPHALP